MNKFKIKTENKCKFYWINLKCNSNNLKNKDKNKQIKL